MDNKILVVIDGSYFVYYTLFGAVSKWMGSSIHAKNLRPANETDQSNLPNLLVYSDFVKSLHDQCVKRFDTVDWLLKQNYQEYIDLADQIDIVFAQDDKLAKNWRKKLYPQYKAQRKLAPQQYDVGAIISYVYDVIFKDLDIEHTKNYNFVKVEGAEGDDVIATVIQNLTGYSKKVLFASDYDFMQLEGVEQYDLMGNRRQTSAKTGGVDLSPRDYLLFKILVGDGSDNIPNIFKGCGRKKALALVEDREKLKSLLKEDMSKANQFKLNRTLIDFKNIPAELQKTITDVVTEKLASNHQTVNNSGSIDINRDVMVL